MEQSPVGISNPGKKVLLVFALFVLLGGGASVAIRITYAELSPFWSNGMRFLLAGAIFWVIVLFKRMRVPRGRALVGAVLFGTLTVGLAFILIGWGLVATPASRYQILMATIPLFTLFLSAVQGIEALSWRGVIGSLLAVVGIGFTVGGFSSAEVSLPHIVAILLAAGLLAEGGVLIKKFPPNPPIMTNAIGMTVGGIILLAASLLSGENWVIPNQVSTWIAFVYLIVFVTILGFLAYLYVLARWSASGTSYAFVLIPLVTIVVASTIAGEEINWQFLVGAGMVLVGVLVGALLPTRKKPVEVEECKDRSGQVVPRCT
jgi:drug/metabolite transporter (DMT)-like permease